MKGEPEFYDEQVFLLHEPISFKITLNDELLEAQIVSVRTECEYEDDDDYDYCPDSYDWFTIKFSDGYIGEYCLGDEELITPEGSDKYAKALYKEIYMVLESWIEDQPVYALTWPIEGKDTNIWVSRFDMVSKVDYSVQFNDDYRFTVKFENDQWTTLTVRIRNPEPIDEALANKVISMLKYHHGQPAGVVHLSNSKKETRKLRIISDLPVNYQLTVPITFIITVQHELLYARIESVRYEYEGYHDDAFTWIDTTHFTIKFSNGYEDEYTIDDDEVCNSKGEDKYTNALQEEICWVLADWTENRPVYTLGWPLDGIETNIWVYRVDCFSETEYFVSYNNDYRFSVMLENDQWTSLTHRIKDPEIIDEALARKVISMLKHYHRKTE